MTALPLADWRDFYVMIGTAAGVIVGATFIVASLAAGLKERMLGLNGFITPTAVHLGSVLIGSAILAAPTLTPLSLALILGASGLAGTTYGIVVAARIWKLKLDATDRTFYVILPIVVYGAIAVATLTVQRSVGLTFNILAVAIVVLLIVGMRNSWDMATFMISRQDPE